MTTNTKWLIGGLIVAAALAVLFAIPRLTGNGPIGSVQLSSGWAVKCIDNAPAIATHIHPELEIHVDGVQENLPGGIGIAPNCVSEIHTHRLNDQIHLELLKDHPVTLGDFFEFWGRPLNRGDYDLEITVNGQLNRELDPGRNRVPPGGTISYGVDKLVLKDKDKIVLEYTSQKGD